MKKTTYSYEIKKIHEKNYNKEKITEKVKKQIDEIGFSVFELDMQIFLNYYESNKDKLEENKKDSSEVKIFIGSSLLAIFLFSLPLLFKFYIKILEKFWFLIILVIGIFTFIDFYYKRKKIEKEVEKKKKNYFNKYVLVTNDKIFIQDKKYYIKNGNILSNQEVEKIIFPEIDFFYEVDKEKIEKINNMMDSIDGEIKNHAKNLKKISFDLENFPKIILELEKEAKSIQDIEGKLWDLKNFIDNWILNQKIILITFPEINIDIKKIENKLKNQILKNIISLKEKFYSELKERIKKEKIGSELTIKNFDGIFSSINKRIEEFKKLCEIEIHSLKQETNQKIEEIENIKNIINERGFCVFEIKNKYRKQEYLAHLEEIVKKNFETTVFTYAAIVFGYLLIIGKILENFKDSVAFILMIPWLLGMFLGLFLKPINIFLAFRKKYFFKNHKGIKNKFAISFEESLIIDKNVFDIKNGDLETNKAAKNFIFLKQDEDYPSEEKINNKIAFWVNIFNKEEKIFSKFYENLAVLENKTKDISEIKENLEKNISENKKVFAKSNEIKSGFEKFQKELENILIIKNKVLNFLKKYFPNEKLSLKKYDLWLKSQILSPLNFMKNILETQLKYANYLLSKNKNSKSEQIQISNKRLELQKNNLEKQIILLDNKIKKLEN